MNDSLIFDYFAGGGGVSEGIYNALGVGADVAINHCQYAIAMHEANHPGTIHLKEDVWNVDPDRDLPPGDVGLAWFSPSCTHHSRARGGKPVSKQLRAQPWVAIRVADRRRPEVIILENVAEFRKWGPVSKDGIPVKGREGQTFRRFIKKFEDLNYVVEHCVLDAADYGAATHRRRLFLIARSDGLPIVWPEPTHGLGRLPYKTAAECIDWSIPSLSIFASHAEARAFAKEHGVGTPQRPLADATQRRIAEGLKRFLFENTQPFIVQVNHGRDKNRSRQLTLPMPTITAKHGFGLVCPTLIQTGHGERPGQTPRIRDIRRPWPTVTAGTGGQPALVSAFLTKFYGTSVGSSLKKPHPTVTAQGQHTALVAAFLTKHGVRTDQPRLGLTVELDGETFAVADIGLRMLCPRELARCQGFPDAYKLTGTQEQQVARIGNSVPPPLAEAIVRANIAQPLDGRRAA